MTNIERQFLEGGKLVDTNGAKKDIAPFLSFTTEQDLDAKLWFNPDEATEDVSFLLKAHQGELTPALSRIALKGIALPLFVRAFYGDDTSVANQNEREAIVQTQHDINTIPERNSKLLAAYMDLVGDPDVDQAMLKQAIDDASVFQLAQLLPEQDDIILLPAGPEEDYDDRPTSFTVLRRRSLGRALLFVSSIRPLAYIHTPEAQDQRIHIRPLELLTENATRYDLAEALIAEQQDSVRSIEDHKLVKTATAHVHDKITRHFDRIQPQN